MNHRRRRVTYRPSKGQSVMGGVMGGVFVLIGLFVIIPTFGVFGIVWTLFAIGITLINLYQALGKGYVGPEIHIEEDGEAQEPAGGVQDRLRALQSLYDQRLITQEEYEEKRKEILKDL